MTRRSLRCATSGIAILNDGYDHRLALQAPADGQVLHGPLDFRTHFKHARLSAIGKPVNWTGQVYMSTGPVDLPTLAGYINFPIEMFAGRIDNAIWADFADGRMTSASGQLAGTDVAHAGAPDPAQAGRADRQFRVARRGRTRATTRCN